MDRKERLIITVMVAVAVVVAVLIALCATAKAYPVMMLSEEEMQTRAEQERYICLYEAATTVEQSEATQDEATYTEAIEYDLSDAEIIACVVYNEAGNGCTDRHQELVAAIIVNRVNDPRFPDTVYDVVTQKNQYHPAYATPGSWAWEKAVNSGKWEHCLEIAEKALRGEVDCPSNVLYQANFAQGTGVYEYGYTSYSTTYFCTG